jgi:hypothetical protein
MKSKNNLLLSLWLRKLCIGITVNEFTDCEDAADAENNSQLPGTIHKSPTERKLKPRQDF